MGLYLLLGAGSLDLDQTLIWFWTELSSIKNYILIKIYSFALHYTFKQNNVSIYITVQKSEAPAKAIVKLLSSE